MVASKSAASSTSSSSSSIGSIQQHHHQRSLIIDTDVGFDDLVALHCLLNTKTRASARVSQDGDDEEIQQPPFPFMMVTTVGGVVSASRGKTVLQTIFPTADTNTNINIMEGLDAPIMPYDPIPDWLVHYRTKGLDGFVESMNMTLNLKNVECSDHDNCTTEDTVTTGQRVVSWILDKQNDEEEGDDTDKRVDILAIGPLTNLSDWITYCEQHPDDTVAKRFAANIRSIYILGGNHPSPPPDDGSGGGDHWAASHEPEFNFGLDPEAARHVLTSPLICDKIHLVTSSVCNMQQLRASVGSQRIQSFVDDNTKKQQEQEQLVNESPRPSSLFYQSLLQHDTVGYSLSCDPVCAFVLEHPHAVTWEHVSVRIHASSGKLVAVPNDSSRSGTTSDDQSSTIRIATKIDLHGYLDWISTTMDDAQRRDTTLKVPQNQGSPIA